MVQLEIEPIGVVLADILHRAGGKGADRIACLSTNIHAAVKLIHTINRVVPVSIDRI